VAITTAFDVALLLERPEATGKLELVWTLIPVVTLNFSRTFLTHISINAVSTPFSVLNIVLDGFKQA
jgi:hypothetical protein